MANKGMELCNMPLDYEKLKITKEKLITKAKIIIKTSYFKNSKAIQCLEDIILYLESKAS